MDYSKFRKLNLEDSLKLYEKAKTGDPDSMVGFACFSLWRKISRDQSLKDKDKVKIYNRFVNSVRFNVKKGRRIIKVYGR